MSQIVFFLLVLLVICMLGMGISALADNAAKKEEHENHIKRVKNGIKDELDSIKTQCAWPSEETLDSLIDYHKKMLLMETDPEIADNLKPYDEYYKGKLRHKSALGDSYSIVVDKFSTPRFVPDIYLSDKIEDKDIELSACPNSKELEKFIDECKKIIMNNKIDKFRKKQIEEKLK